MKIFLKIALYSVLTASMFLSSEQADALELKRYDGMSPADQTRYNMMLLNGTVDYLFRNKDAEGIKKINELFTREEGSKEFPKGMLQYAQAIKQYLDKERKEPSKVYHVEQIMAMFLHHYGVKIPMTEMALFVKDFKRSDEQFGDHEMPEK